MQCHDYDGAMHFILWLVTTGIGIQYWFNGMQQHDGACMAAHAFNYAVASHDHLRLVLGGSGSNFGEWKAPGLQAQLG